MNDFKINSLTSRVTRITAPCGEMMYLLEGSEKAALIDSGLGFGSPQSSEEHPSELESRLSIAGGG